jgi:hypothetical protein
MLYMHVQHAYAWPRSRFTQADELTEVPAACAAAAASMPPAPDQVHEGDAVYRYPSWHTLHDVYIHIYTYMVSLVDIFARHKKLKGCSQQAASCM